jgi:glutamate dehydrogenase/leucine dehydrogenase
MRKASFAITLSPGDRAQLGKWESAQGTPQQVALRCRIVLMALAGEIGDGVQVKFAATTGHTGGDLWKFDVTPYYVELENLTRRYATEISILMGPERDIPAPDVNTNAQTMAWIMDTVSMHRGYTVPAVITGKPIALGGSLGRNEATARGVSFVVKRAAAEKKIKLDGASVVVQGYGNAGAIAARLLAEFGISSAYPKNDL